MSLFGLSLPTTVPLPPTVPDARRELSDELWNPAYAGTWWDRFNHWLADALMVRAGEANLDASLALFLIALLVLAAVVIAIMWRRRRRHATTAEDDTALFDGEPVRTAATYRERAEEHERAGRWDRAVLDRYRAIAAVAVERGVVSDSPDLTAHEVSSMLARSFPQLADATRHAGSVFDRIRYGGGQADQRDAAALADLDRDLAQAQPTAHPAASRSLAVPR